MAAALQTSLQARPGRAQAALSLPRYRINAWRGDRCRWAPYLPPPPPPPLVAVARPAVVRCSAGSAGQPADPHPDKQPRQPFNWAGILRGVGVALLSPILFPLYILLVDPPDPFEDDASIIMPASKPWQRHMMNDLVFFGGHMAVFVALKAGVAALGPFTGPAWAEAAANTLLGNGRVGEVLTAWTMLSVPRSPTMQLCTLLAIFCFYRCSYHFEAWRAARFRRPPHEEETPSRRSARLAVQRMLYQPRGRALWSVFVFVGGLGKLLKQLAWIIGWPG